MKLGLSAWARRWWNLRRLASGELLSRIAEAERQTKELHSRLNASFELSRAAQQAASGESAALRAESAALRAELATARGRIEALSAHLDRLEGATDSTRSRSDVEEKLFAALEAFRDSETYRRIYEDPTPLVSVCICTYNRARLLTERCLPSVMAQTYRNLEIIVVGDGCTDETADAVARLGDPRIHFENLPRRATYPKDAELRWMVAGSDPANRSFELARGDLVTHIDDDDEFMPQRIDKLVAFLRDTRSELVWHPFACEPKPGEWAVNQAEAFRYGQVTTGSVLYLSWFKVIPWDAAAYRFREPGDWNRLRKFQYLGARISRCSDVLLRHYVEHANVA